jgi:lantibiotic modifying enzyme
VYAVIIRLLAITPASRKSEVWADVEELLRTGDRPGLGPYPKQVVRAEMRALSRGDVPYWSTSTCSRDIWEAGGGRSSEIATLTCMECIARRVSRMNEMDLGRQTWLLESFLRGSNQRGRPS